MPPTLTAARRRPATLCGFLGCGRRAFGNRRTGRVGNDLGNMSRPTRPTPDGLILESEDVAHGVGQMALTRGEAPQR